ncbi:hypothetical protein Fbal_3242 [Ferrimonas balearica DSM 9799]|uniref:Uncharacterized protein n=1 Tax=Ferrimonas balearica (strain DSM 9799 / CCM 4581 / KCTC 23876 / PAT) TaxID=550540 RepID=E1SVZ0_FERBD|nr:protein DpdG [Ferrimonas balearica]ADN77441.1 hypothetical protein Fbal_3242 [Ferrimonas balearica DSM 9799]
MPIINNDHGGSQFEVLTVIHNVLKGNKGNPMEQNELIAWCRPDALLAEGKTSARSKLGKELSAWTELGLLETVGGGFRLRPCYFTDPQQQLSTGARRCLLAAENNKDLSSRDQRAVDLTVLLCMLLALDVYRYPAVQSNNLANIVDRYLTDFRINTNETPIVPSYAHWLGFMTRTGNGVYCIDPTSAIKEEISAHPSKFKPGEQLPIGNFVQQLATLLPVLDGGNYRKQVEQRIEGPSWSQPKETDLSTSLSRALLRLHHSGQLQLQKLSDAGLRNLIGPNREVLMAVTHVTVRGEQ